MNTEEWNIIKDGSHGQVFEKKDGSVIVTGTWDGKGFQYTVHYQTLNSLPKEQDYELDNGMGTKTIFSTKEQEPKVIRVKGGDTFTAPASLADHPMCKKEQSDNSTGKEIFVQPNQKGLSHGVYIINWSDEHGGGSSLASVGFTHDGTNWFAPCNWTCKSNDYVMVASTKWEYVKSIILIDKNNYDKSAEPPTPSNDIQEVKEDTKVLFTMENEEPIYNKLDLWVVDTAFGYTLHRATNYNTSRFKLKYFSTKEAAEQYILENKPCLSLNDLLEVWDNRGITGDTHNGNLSPMYKRFEQKAKQKLNQK